MSQNDEFNNNGIEEEQTDNMTDDAASEEAEEETIDFSELEDTIDISALMNEKKEEEEPAEEPPATGIGKIKKGFRSMYDSVVKILMVPEDSDALLDEDEYDGDIFSDENEKKSAVKKADSKTHKEKTDDNISGADNASENDSREDDADTYNDFQKKKGFFQSAINSILGDPEYEEVHTQGEEVKQSADTIQMEIDNENTDSSADKPDLSRSETEAKPDVPAADANIKPKKSRPSVKNKNNGHPGTLASASLYRTPEAAADKPKEKAVYDDVSDEQETAFESISDEAEIPAPAVNAKQGLHSEITIDDILRAKNSVPERSSKTYMSVAVSPVRKESEQTAAVSDKKVTDKKPVVSADVQKRKPVEHITDKEQARKKRPADSGEKKITAAVGTSIENEKPKNNRTAAAVSENVHKSKPVKIVSDREKPKAHKPSDVGEKAHKPEPADDRADQKQQKSAENVRQIRPAVNEPDKPDTKVQKTDTADELPGGEGVKIEPWAPEKKKKKAARKDDAVIYRSAEANPLVVMAGKFTNTLKAEYENTRKIRQASGAVSAAESTQSAPIRPAVQTKPETIDEIKNKHSGSRRNNAVKDADKPVNINNAKRDTVQKKPVSKAAKADEKEKKKFHIKDIFDYEGDRFDEEEEEVEVGPEISDYTKEEDADEIKGDINENFRKVFVRTGILACTFIASAITAVVAKTMPWIFLNMLKNGWLVYSAVMFLLFLVSVYISRFPLFNGFFSLKKLRGNSDTPISVAAIAVALQSIVSLFQPNVFLNETYHIYVPLLILSLLLSSLGKLLIIRRTADNFRFLRSDKAKYAGKIYTNMQNAERFVSGLPSRRPIIAYSKYSKFMSNFLQLSYAADPVEELSGILAPISAAISLIASILFGVVTKDFVGGISFFAMSTCITIPMCSLLAINIPMLKLCSSANRSGAMIVGYEAVKQFCDTNTVMFESSDLYPKGTIVLSGMKTLNESKLREAISAGASMTFAVNGPLTHVFETIVRQSKYDLPEYESVSYDDDMGLSGWCNGSRILIGTRELFKKHNIRLPDESIETRYRKRGNEIIYISVGGELAVMFILTYKVDKAIAQSLRDLEDSGVSFVVRTIDPVVNQKHIAEKFSLYPRCIRVLPANIGKVCHEELSAKEKTSRAYLVTNGKLSAFANAVAGCIRIKSTVTIAKIVQYLAIIIGFILVTVIAFVSGFAKLGSVELLFYIGFWCAALIIVSLAARKLS